MLVLFANIGTVVCLSLLPSNPQIRMGQIFIALEFTCEPCRIAWPGFQVESQNSEPVILGTNFFIQTQCLDMASQTELDNDPRGSYRESQPIDMYFYILCNPPNIIVINHDSVAKFNASWPAHKGSCRKPPPVPRGRLTLETATDAERAVIHELELARDLAGRHQHEDCTEPTSVLDADHWFDDEDHFGYHHHVSNVYGLAWTTDLAQPLALHPVEKLAIQESGPFERAPFRKDASYMVFPDIWNDLKYSACAEKKWYEQIQVHFGFAFKTLLKRDESSTKSSWKFSSGNNQAIDQDAIPAELLVELETI